MSSLHFSCGSGVSGDMIVGALLDLGSDEERLVSELAKLQLSSFSVSCRKVRKCGVSATKFDVVVKEEAKSRSLDDVLGVVEKSTLSPEVKDLSKRIFLTLGYAEATAHDTSLGDVHFHEVGAIDAIVDVVSAAILLTEVGAEKVSCSTIAIGSGKVESAHGVFDVPAPAVKHLLEGAPTAKTSVPVELTTPTGAAIMKTIVSDFTDSVPESERIGYGAGMRDLEKPNVLEARIF